MAKLDKTETALSKSYDHDEWISIDNFEAEKIRHAQVARHTMKKDKRINIRISEKDLNGLKLKAVEDGVPYQTLISSILHKFVSGRLVEKS
ncbi:antitoxin [bacterium]|nr:antitoxin [bacterium]